MTEKWLPIANYEDLYEISNKGNFKSYTVNWKNGSKIIQTFMSMRSDSPLIALTKNGSINTFTAARLVLSHFNREPKRGEIVGYADGDKTNTELSNLFWSNRSRLNLEMVGKIRELKKKHTQKECAAKLDLPLSLIYSALYNWQSA